MDDGGAALNRSGLIGSSWPSPRQELVLQAALLDGSRAAAAWAAVGDSVDPARHDPDGEVQRLLPLVHHNLRRHGAEDARSASLANLARQSWWATRRTLDGAAPTLEFLLDRGVPTMALKGAPLAIDYYANPGHRPITDVDVLVPTGSVKRVFGLLGAEGWAVMSRIRIDEVVRLRHSTPMEHPDHGTFDIHWHPSLQLVGPDRARSDEWFWAASVPLEIGGVATRAMGPADMLVHVCVHGAWSTSGAQLRWAADACTIIERAGDRLDWDRVVATAQRFLLVSQMRNDLAYVASVLDAPVPGAVLEELWAMPVSDRELRTHRALTRDIPEHGPRAAAGRFRACWAEKSGSWTRRRQVLGLPEHIRDQLCVDRTWQIPSVLLGRTVGYLRAPRRGAARP